MQCYTLLSAITTLWTRVDCMWFYILGNNHSPYTWRSVWSPPAHQTETHWWGLNYEPDGQNSVAWQFHPGALIWQCSRCRAHCFYCWNNNGMMCTRQGLIALTIRIPNFLSNSCRIMSLRWWEDYTLTGRWKPWTQKPKCLQDGSRSLPCVVAAVLVVQKMPWYIPGWPASLVNCSQESQWEV